MNNGCVLFLSLMYADPDPLAEEGDGDREAEDPEGETEEDRDLALEWMEDVVESGEGG